MIVAFEVLFFEANSNLLKAMIYRVTIENERRSLLPPQGSCSQVCQLRLTIYIKIQ